MSDKIQIEFTVVEADGLFKKRGRIDPYAAVTIDGTTRKSRVLKDTDFPRWNDKFDFRVTKLQGTVATVKVYCQRLGFPDEKLCMFQLDLSPLAQETTQLKLRLTQLVKLGEKPPDHIATIDVVVVVVDDPSRGGNGSGPDAKDVDEDWLEVEGEEKPQQGDKATRSADLPAETTTDGAQAAVVDSAEEKVSGSADLPLLPEQPGPEKLEEDASQHYMPPPPPQEPYQPPPQQEYVPPPREQYVAPPQQYAPPPPQEQQYVPSQPPQYQPPPPQQYQLPYALPPSQYAPPPSQYAPPPQQYAPPPPQPQQYAYAPPPPPEHYGYAPPQQVAYPAAQDWGPPPAPAYPELGGYPSYDAPSQQYSQSCAPPPLPMAYEPNPYQQPEGSHGVYAAAFSVPSALRHWQRVAHSHQARPQYSSQNDQQPPPDGYSAL